MQVLKQISKLFFLLFLAGISSIPQCGFAQTVGLVLSGGGAKGASHIGVIKALEEEGIPIDYITGTSMGAVIGGLYASGYSPEQMDSMIMSEDFMNAIEGILDEKYNYHFMKPDPDAGWIKLHFNFDTLIQPKLPNVFMPTEQLEFLIMDKFAMASAAANYDFDSLFIPFRCVASDIGNNTPVIMKDGDLGFAIRASMSFPFYFKPVKMDDKIMMDGGMYNNFPSDIMYEDFFPDIIIGSKAVSNYKPPELDDVISQIQTMLMINTEYSIICDNGVLIEPELPRVNILDFSRSREMIDSGYTSALRSIPEIRKFLLKHIDKKEVEKRRKLYLKEFTPLLFDSVKVKGLPEKQGAYVQSSFKIINDPWDIDRVKTEYYKLISDEKISSISPHAILKPGNENYCLYLDVSRNKDLQVTLGGNISSNPSNEAFLELNYNHLRKQALSITANTYIGRFYSAVKLGSRIDFPGQTPFYIDLSFSMNQWDYFKTTTYFFEDKNPSYLIENENNMFINMGWPATQTGKIELGYVNAAQRFDYYQANSFTREDTADRTRFAFQAGHLMLEFNSLNRKQYPTRGMLFRTKARYLWGREINTPGSTSLIEEENSAYHNWFELEMLYDNYFLTHKRYTLGFFIKLHISNQTFFNNYTSSLLASPAFNPVPESKTLFLSQFRAYNYAAIGVKNIFPISKTISMRAEVYFFQPFQEILEAEMKTATFGELFATHYIMASAALIYQSPLGPVSLSLNHYSTSNDPWTLVFSFGYVIFNRKARD